MVCKSDGNHKDTISYFNNAVVCCFHESLNQKRDSGVFFYPRSDQHQFSPNYDNT